MIDESDSLRTVGRATQPDSRTLAFVRVNIQTGETRPTSLEDQYNAVADFRLNECVPEDVAIHFETAKNLYFYSWFVYRFYPVAEQQTLATLEFALRMRQPQFVEDYKKKHRFGHEPGLGTLLRKAIDDGLIRNEAFPQHEEWALRRARGRFKYEQIEKMHREGLEEMIMDDSGVVATEEDLNYDWLGTFADAIPDIRNIYAHGSSMLVPTVLHSFDVVTAIINQLFPESSGNRP
jgi:hypothetical protein